MPRKLNLAYLHKNSEEIRPEEMSELKAGDGCVCVISSEQAVTHAAIYAQPDDDPCPCEGIAYYFGLWW